MISGPSFFSSPPNVLYRYSSVFEVSCSLASWVIFLGNLAVKMKFSGVFFFHREIMNGLGSL